MSKSVRYNPLTATYDTTDGTKVAAELVDSVQCLADVLYIAQIREAQRAEQFAEANASPDRASCPRGER